MQRTISQLWREPPAPKRTAAETHMSIVLPDEARTVVTGDFAPGATLGEVISFAASQYSRTTGRTTRAEDLEAPPFTETDRLRAISSLQDGRTLVLHFRRPSASSASASTSAASETRLLPSPVRPPPQEQLPVSWSRTDAWDEDHVKMPCSPRNGTAEGAQKWPIIVGILSTLRSGASAASLSRAILDINPAQATKWDLRGLLRFFESEACPAQEASEFFARTLPRMAALAARLPTLCPEPIPLLSKRKSATVVLSQLQIASLLANAFFCTFPRRNEPLVSSHVNAHFQRLSSLLDGTRKNSQQRASMPPSPRSTSALFSSRRRHRASSASSSTTFVACAPMNPVERSRSLVGCFWKSLTGHRAPLRCVHFVPWLMAT